MPDQEVIVAGFNKGRNGDKVLAKLRSFKGKAYADGWAFIFDNPPTERELNNAGWARLSPDGTMLSTLEKGWEKEGIGIEPSDIVKVL